MNERVLIVDDEVNVLDGLQSLLRRDFAVKTSVGAEAALQLLATSGPFAVIVSDMRMPGMDGVQFLRTVRERVPDSVRLMLTGNADIQTAIDAVNEGSVFRFLTKPCPPEILKGALRAGIRQYRLVIAERELLEKTLHGSVKAFSEILALVNPAAFSRATRIHRTVQSIAKQLSPRETWPYEVAAMLSQIGCVALDTDTVEAVYSGAALPAAEQERFKMHPSIAHEFLKDIPRLETVSMMINWQMGTSDKKSVCGEGVNANAARRGAEIIAVAIEFDQLCLSGVPRTDAIARLQSQPSKYDPLILAALEEVPVETLPYVIQTISIREMSVGMILDQDLRTPSGLLWAARDQKISYPLLVRIRNLNQKMPVTDKIRVKVVRPEAMATNNHGTH